uniref:Extended synaptotagmin-like protein 2a n=1 Tax=Astatotilapia calliptera TaxID=8154 RepID=A0AAX7UD00_ASTCA
MDGPAGEGAKANGPIAAPNTPTSTMGPPLSPEELAEEQQSSLTDVTQMWINFAKTFALIFPIYVLGYFEFSFSWVLIGLAMLFYWRKNYGNGDYRINRALAFLQQEEKAVKQSVPTTELPPWVHYPDVERVEWLNKTVKQMWPFICQFVEKLFRETIEPAVKGANPHLSTFCFTKIDMGDKPLRVNGVKVYTENVDKRQVIMDLQISFVGNTEIDVDIKKYYCRAGIKSIQLHGVMRVVMEPLLGDIPLIGALSVFFLKKPLLDINWTGLTNMLDIPGVNGLCDNLLQDIIYSYLVLPNRINIPLVSEAQMARLRFPIPKCILRIHFIEAQELLRKDKFLGGLVKGKSDPYGVIKIGTDLYQSKVIRDTVNPKWNEVYEALVYDHSGSMMIFAVITILLFLKYNNNFSSLQWFPLEDVATGKLHLKLEWLSLLSTPERLDQVLSGIRADRSQASDGLSSAVLIVFLDSARNLPSVFEGNLGSGYLKERRASGLVFCENTASLYRSLFRNPLEFNQAGLRKGSVSKAIKSGKKVTSDPSPFVQFRVGHKSYESKVRYKTHEPLWEETFTFLIHNPKVQELEVEVKDEKHDCSLGTLTLPLTRLLEAEEMTLNQRFPLRNSGPSCTLKIKMALRVRKSEQKEAKETMRTQQSMDFGQDGSVGGGGKSLAETGRSTSNLAISGSQQYLASGKEPTPSIASDISNPYAAQELQQRLEQFHNGSGPSLFPLGEIQLTIRHSSQRNKLIVAVHSCRNLIAFTDHGSDPYVRLYLLPDKRRSGRRKTPTVKKNLNPVYDFSVSLVELHRRNLDVAVKNGGGLLSKHKGLLGKVMVELTHDQITKGWTQWLVVDLTSNLFKTNTVYFIMSY